jgi:hypothetical protein
MDFRRRKLRLALGIMALGMLVALVWHGIQGWGFGRGYPDNTFLFQPGNRFTDLFGIKSARDPNPYSYPFALYFPSTYLTFTSMGLIGLTWLALRPLGLGATRHGFAAIGLVALSYPMWYGLDRGNLEMPMALCVGGALLCFRARHYGFGLACLFPAIGVKFYPIFLTALFLRPRHWFKIVAVSLAFLGLSLFSLAMFAVPMEKSWEEWSHWGRLYSFTYIIQNWGLSGSASLWNTFKALVLGAYALAHPAYRPTIDPFPFALVHRAYAIYWLFAFIGFGIITLYALFIETLFFRRAILLLIESLVFIPSGADYRLVYVNIALVVLILLPQPRRHDLLVTGLLAFILVPKKEFFLTFLGPTDSPVNDISFGILINPPCLLAVVVLLMWDGRGGNSWLRMRRRIWGLIGSLGRWIGKLRPYASRIASGSRPIERTQSA